MVQNFPGPYELRIKYTADNPIGGTLSHTQRLNFAVSGVAPDPGTPFDQIPVLLRNGANTDLATVTETWLADLVPLYNSTSVFGPCEVWKYKVGTFEADFVTSYDPVLNAGTSGSQCVAAGQVILTFRTEEGGIMRISLMETILPRNPQIAISSTDTPQAIKDIADYVAASNTPWLGRDTSYPFARLNYSPGENEALFKKRFRTLSA